MNADKMNIIKAFQESGKQVHAFLSVDMATEKELYLVAAADSITLNPTSGVLIDGLMAELVFMKRTMEKLRIRPEFIQFKEYKNPEIYSRQSMTPEFEEITVVLRGTLQVDSAEGRLEVRAGQAVIAAPGEAVGPETVRLHVLRCQAQGRVQVGAGHGQVPSLEIEEPQ